MKQLIRPRGNQLPHSKLNPQLVRMIRANREGMSDKARASQLGVHYNVIWRVRHYEAWAWVEQESAA